MLGSGLGLGGSLLLGSSRAWAVLGIGAWRSLWSGWSSGSFAAVLAVLAGSSSGSRATGRASFAWSSVVAFGSSIARASFGSSGSGRALRSGLEIGSFVSSGSGRSIGSRCASIAGWASWAGSAVLAIGSFSAGSSLLAWATGRAFLAGFSFAAGRALEAFATGRRVEPSGYDAGRAGRSLATIGAGLSIGAGRSGWSGRSGRARILIVTMAMSTVGLTSLTRLAHHMTPRHIGQLFEFVHLTVQLVLDIRAILEEDRNRDDAGQHGDGAQADGR